MPLYFTSFCIFKKVLAENSGFDVQEIILQMISEYRKNKTPIGVNCTDVNSESENKTISPVMQGIWDTYIMKKQWLHIAPTLTQ